MNKKNLAYKLSLSGILVAISTFFGTFSIPVFGGKMSPVQHFINVVMAVTLGPWYALLGAFVTSLLRNILGTGTLLAFPGSMVGAVLGGLLYKKFKKIHFAVIGEIIGTGLLGALIAYPFAVLFMGKTVAVFAYIIPFSISCIGGAIIAFLFLNIPAIKKTIEKSQEEH